MAEYKSLRVPQLEELLKQRGLPHNGKKAELISRLQEDDSKQLVDAQAATAGDTKGAKASGGNEDEIDWDDETGGADDAKKDAEKPMMTSANTAKPGTKSGPAKSAAGKAKTATAASKTTDASKEDTATAAQDTTTTITNAQPDTTSTTAPDDPAPAANFSLGLASATLDDELAKRAARAKKFGLSENEPAADEALKRLERAKKFGATESEGPRGLNEALPERRKRGRGEDGEGRGDFKRRGGGGSGRGGGGRRFERNGGGGRRRGGGGGGGRDGDDVKPGKGSWMSEQDRKAAEARKARFTA